MNESSYEKACSKIDNGNCMAVPSGKEVEEYMLENEDCYLFN